VGVRRSAITAEATAAVAMLDWFMAGKVAALAAAEVVGY